MAHAERYALASLPVAFFLWYVTFQVNALSFWERISLSTVYSSSSPSASGGAGCA